jgi:hypothetical protein
MKKRGRPETKDPKTALVGVRLSKLYMMKLKKVALDERVPVATAARNRLMDALDDVKG